jgi:hypothetical protein
MEHATPEAREKYLHDHPNADPADHTVKKDEGKKKPSFVDKLKDTGKKVLKTLLVGPDDVKIPDRKKHKDEKYDDYSPSEYFKWNPTAAVRFAMEHPTPESREKYLHDHPNANPQNHTVKEKGESGEKGAPLRPEHKEFSDKSSPYFINTKNPHLKSLGDDPAYWDRDKVRKTKNKLYGKIKNMTYKPGSPEEAKYKAMDEANRMLGNFLLKTPEEDR